MNSIVIGERKKQAMEIQRSMMKKNHSRKKHLRKTSRPKTKKQDTVKIVEFEPTNIDRMNQGTKNHQSLTPLPTINLVKKSTQAKKFRIPIANHHRFCSTRGVVVTFIIILILVLAAGMAVGIVFATINSQKTSQNGGNSNSNLNSCR